jgi:hypothetical protein
MSDVRGMHLQNCKKLHVGAWGGGGGFKMHQGFHTLYLNNVEFASNCTWTLSVCLYFYKI